MSNEEFASTYQQILDDYGALPRTIPEFNQGDVDDFRFYFAKDYRETDATGVPTYN
ncbi:hypothetical protein VVR85_04860 [Corynebacterium sp. LK2590]|uniref:hypothetical protein n=1 Tax=unclassified Corynebacterium TaxID=2624378 RepID=UPI0034CE7BF8